MPAVIVMLETSPHNYLGALAAGIIIAVILAVTIILAIIIMLAFWKKKHKNKYKPRMNRDTER